MLLTLYSHAKNGTEFLTLTVRKLIHLLEKDTLALGLTLVFCVVYMCST